MEITIPYCPFEHQLEVHEDDTRFRIISAGRRAGKTISAFHEMFRHALVEPKSLLWWVAPTYKDAKEVGWQAFVDLQEVLAPAVHSVHKTNLRIELVNDSVIYFKGAENYNSLRGRGLDFVVMDEAAFQHEDVWKKVLRPALSDKRGEAMLISSPNGRNWFYEMYQAAAPSNPYWNRYRWPTSINPLITEDDLEAAKADLAINDFRQEYLAEFVTQAGMVYDDFSEENCIDDFELTPLHSIYLGIDFGFANPTSVVFVAVRNDEQEVVVFDEIYKGRLPMPRLVELINQKLGKHGIAKSRVTWIATDPAGNADELTSGISPVDYLRMKGGFEVINKGTRIAPGLSLVRSYICNALGRRRLFIHKPNCPDLVRSLFGYTYSQRQQHLRLIDEEPLKDGVHDHACDALRYFFVNRFDHARYVTSKIPQQNYLDHAQTKTSNWYRCTRCHRKFYSRVREALCSECKEQTHGDEVA